MQNHGTEIVYGSKVWFSLEIYPKNVSAHYTKMCFE